MERGLFIAASLYRHRVVLPAPRALPATPEQMAALTELNAALAAKAEEIAGNVVANTQAA